MSAKPVQKQNAPKLSPRAPAKPWGQKILAEKAVALLREGAMAPSAIFANVLIASMAPALDLEILSAQPRAMSDEVNRIIASALQKYRAPNPDVDGILGGLMSLAWAPKSSQPPAAAGGHAKGTADARRPHSSSVKKGGKPSSGGRGPRALGTKVAAAAPAAPLIVRKASRGLGGE